MLMFRYCWVASELFNADNQFYLGTDDGLARLSTVADSDVTGYFRNRFKVVPSLLLWKLSNDKFRTLADESKEGGKPSTRLEGRVDGW